MNQTNDNLTWQAPEFKWQATPAKVTLIATALGIILALASLIWRNYLLTLLIVLVTIVFYILKNQKPLTLEVDVSTMGIKYGKKFYRFSDINNFRIVYQPPEIKTLNLKPKGLVSWEIVIQLEDQNPNLIREFLLNYLSEDEEVDESLNDKIVRLLKI